MPRCYAQEFPVFQPAMRLIEAISNTNPVEVTTTFNNQYVDGTQVRLDIPVLCGMQQINGQTGPITVIGPTTFSMPIDATLYDPFTIPGAPGPHDNICAMVVPIGEITSTLQASLVNILPHHGNV